MFSKIRFAVTLETIRNTFFYRTICASKKHHSRNIRPTSESSTLHSVRDSNDQTERLKVDVDEFDEKKSEFDFIGNDSAKLKQLKIIQLQVDLWRQRGVTLPKKLQEKHWLKLLSIDSEDQKLRYLTCVWKNETMKMQAAHLRAVSLKKHREMKSKEQPPPKFTTSGPLVYTLTYNTLFHRIRDDKIERFYNYRLLQAASFGPHLIVDCGLQSNVNLLTKQILALFMQNRNSSSPYNIIFCNFFEDTLIESLRRRWLSFGDPALPFQHTSKNYTDLFSKKKLVYISPLATNALEHYNHDDIYIIPGIANYKDFIQITTKIKKESLRSVRFPVKEMKSAGDREVFTPIRILKVLDDFRENRDWNNALKHFYIDTAQDERDDKSKFYFCDRSIQSNIYDSLLKGKK